MVQRVMIILCLALSISVQSKDSQILIVNGVCRFTDAIRLSSKTHGIYANLQRDSKVEVRMYDRRLYTTGGRQDIGALVYGAFIDSSDPEYHEQRWLIEYKACNKLLESFACRSISHGSTYKSYSNTFKSRLLNAAKENREIQKESWLGNEFDAVIEIELFGQASFNDIDRVSLPGLDDIQPGRMKLTWCDQADNWDSNFCQRLQEVRSISDLTKTDFIIQAHRGIWGEEYNENTLGAMKRARNHGLFLVESDIMPYGITNFHNPEDSDFATPGGLACFHDYITNRYSNYEEVFSKDDRYFFQLSRDEIKKLNLTKPRSNEVGSEKILLFEELVTFIGKNDMMLCVDMKHLQNNGKGKKCLEMCHFEDANLQHQSLMKNMKWAIEKAASIGTDDKNYLHHITFKTYDTYEDLKRNLLGIGLSEELFNQVLWAPMIALNDRWKRTDNRKKYNPERLKDFLDDWFRYNDVVLYYEVNFFNDYDGKTSLLVSDEEFWSAQEISAVNAMEYIYLKTGRRAGIFSEEPVGGRGVVNRWGRWKMKKSFEDKRGDHLWLLSWPYMKHAVYTTERVDVWEQLKD